VGAYRLFRVTGSSRFSCDKISRPGNPATTQRLPWYEPRGPHTKAFDDWLMLNLINSAEADEVKLVRST